MTEECFCGCGLHVKGMAARISRKGAEVKRLGEVLEDGTLPVVHGEEDARSVDRGKLNHWLRSALKLERATTTQPEPALALSSAPQRLRTRAPTASPDLAPGRRVLTPEDMDVACPACGKIFRTRQQMEAHRASRHGPA